MTATTPITRYMRRISTRLRQVAEGDATKLTLGSFIDLMGPGAHRLLLFVLALLNMIPGPPGFGGILGWTTLAVALAMVLGRPIRLPGILARRKLPLQPLVIASRRAIDLAGLLSRFSKPRLRVLTGPLATIPYGIFVMLVSLVMVIPVPFINAIPNVGLSIIAFSMLNRDGAGVVLGGLVTVFGVGVALALAVGAVRLGGAAAEALW